MKNTNSLFFGETEGEAEVIKLTNRNTPMRDIMPRIRGNGSAHLWNQRIALGNLLNNNQPLELFYKDGGLPVTSDPQYVQKAVLIFCQVAKKIPTEIFIFVAKI